MSTSTSQSNDFWYAWIGSQKCFYQIYTTLHWRHNECNGVLNHQLHDCLLNLLFRRRSKKTSNLRVTGLCEGNSPVIDEFPAQRASNAENVSIWWRHYECWLSQLSSGRDQWCSDHMILKRASHTWSTLTDDQAKWYTLVQLRLFCRHRHL